MRGGLFRDLDSLPLSAKSQGKLAALRASVSLPVKWPLLLVHSKRLCEC